MGMDSTGCGDYCGIESASWRCGTYGDDGEKEVA